MDCTKDQGKFISNGQDKVLRVQSGADWVEVYNYSALSQLDSQGNAVDVANKFFYTKWQRGMLNNAPVKYYYQTNDRSDTAFEVGSSDSIVVKDRYEQELRAVGGASSSSTANPPLITTASAHGLVTGDVVRLSGFSGALQLCGIDFVVTVASATTFTIPQIAGTPSAPGTGGTVNKVVFDDPFQPSSNAIIRIVMGQSTVVHTSKNHNFKIGSKVRLSIPELYGAQHLNESEATITSVTDTSFTLNVNTSGKDSFNFPTTFSPKRKGASSVAYAQDTAYTRKDPNRSDAPDLQLNEGGHICILKGGEGNPAGDANDVIFWRSGTSFSIQNEDE